METAETIPDKRESKKVQLYMMKKSKNHFHSVQDEHTVFYQLTVIPWADNHNAAVHYQDGSIFSHE